MVDIPPEIKIKASLSPGSVFYFEEETLTSNEPHYFVVLNKEPITDPLLLMVCSSSQLDKVKLRNVNNNPNETLIEVSPSEYSEFSKQSIFDCNSVFLKSMDDLVNKLSNGVLKLKNNIPSSLLTKLREGVKASPIIPLSQKRILD